MVHDKVGFLSDWTDSRSALFTQFPSRSVLSFQKTFAMSSYRASDIICQQTHKHTLELSIGVWSHSSDAIWQYALVTISWTRTSESYFRYFHFMCFSAAQRLASTVGTHKRASIVCNSKMCFIIKMDFYFGILIIELAERVCNAVLRRMISISNKTVNSSSDSHSLRWSFECSFVRLKTSVISACRKTIYFQRLTQWRLEENTSVDSCCCCRLLRFRMNRVLRWFSRGLFSLIDFSAGIWRLCRRNRLWAFLLSGFSCLVGFIKFVRFTWMLNKH